MMLYIIERPYSLSAHDEAVAVFYGTPTPSFRTSRHRKAPLLIQVQNVEVIFGISILPCLITTSFTLGSDIEGLPDPKAQ